jgi:hypothetical protein
MPSRAEEAFFVGRHRFCLRRVSGLSLPLIRAMSARPLLPLSVPFAQTLSLPHSTSPIDGSRSAGLQ